MISYDDLDLRVRADGDGFVVDARRGTQSASESFQLDLSQCWELWQPEERSPQEAERVGMALFDALIRGRVRDLYQQGRGSAGSDPRKGLRIRILLDPRDERLRPLLRLPWEVLFDRSADAGRRLAPNARFPVVRTLDSFEMTLSPTLEKLERVLLAYAKPEGLPWIDADVECTRVQEVLVRRSIRPEVLSRVMHSDLFDSISDRQPQIVHFMGHGTFDQGTGEGALMIENAENRAEALPASTFAQFFSDKPMPRLVILTACYSAEMGGDPDFGPFAGVAASLIAHGLPAVIAMQAVLQDRSAIRFTERLYECLVDGNPVEAAVANARKALSGQWATTLDWALPVLFVRGATEVFTEEARVPSPQPPEEPQVPTVRAEFRNERVGQQIIVFGTGNVQVNGEKT